MSIAETVTMGGASPRRATIVDPITMAGRGQLTDGIIDGSPTFDNAIGEHTARIGKIDFPIAGGADILLALDLEADNMVARQLQYLVGSGAA